MGRNLDGCCVNILLHISQIILYIATGWLVAPTNINNAQTSLNCALECGLHELISGRKKKKRNGELEVIADTSGG